MMINQIDHFDFGENWDSFSNEVLDNRTLDLAISSIQQLLGRETLVQKNFLDVGCGSGLFSLAAHQLQAEKVVGFDINPRCIDTSKRNKEDFLPDSSISFILGSALDSEFLNSLGKFDVVYAWGSLHHTGSMWDSIRNICQMVNPDGILILSIYNKHITSPLWVFIKRLYNIMPRVGKKLMVLTFGLIIYITKFLYIGRNPLEKERGMDFWYDIVDWIGGYPYEYATPQDIEKSLVDSGFKLVRFIPAQVPTGCNEFVFSNNIS